MSTLIEAFNAPAPQAPRTPTYAEALEKLAYRLGVDDLMNGHALVKRAYRTREVNPAHIMSRLITSDTRRYTSDMLDSDRRAVIRGYRLGIGLD